MCILYAAEFYQSIPAENRTVCSGEKLQYTCSVEATHIIWGVTCPGCIHVLFGASDPVNEPKPVGNFIAVLTENNGTFYSSTLTSYMVPFSYNGLTVTCFKGDVSMDRTINIIGTVHVCKWCHYALLTHLLPPIECAVHDLHSAHMYIYLF